MCLFTSYVGVYPKEENRVVNRLPTVAKGGILRHYHWCRTSLVVFISDMASAPAQQPTLTVEQTRVVLSEVIQAFSVPENAARMEEARESACNDMGKMLQLVLPVATQIQQEVIKAYGFNNEGEGVLKFARLVKMYETQDPEIAAMSAKLKSLLLPPLSTPPIGGAIPAS
ncbi:protein C10 isoform X1 [Amphiprion ocellaris]|nr:protein C10 isoform X1 [Amphiprion ocellaris]